MPASVIPKHFTDGSVTFKDGTGTPVTLSVPFTMGDCSISGLAQDALGRATNAYETRGVLVGLRRGAREYPTFSMSLMVPDVSDGSNVTPLDFIRKKGAYTSNVSTTTALGDVYTIDIVLTIEGTDLGDAADHTFTLEDVDCRADFAEGEPNTLTINGTIYGTITPA
jgi:hypothetical protein